MPWPEAVGLAVELGELVGALVEDNDDVEEGAEEDVPSELVLLSTTHTLLLQV